MILAKISHRLGRLIGLKSSKEPRRAAGYVLRDWQRYIPEAILIVGALLLLDMFVLDNDRYASLAYIPLWAPILIMSAHYGLFGGAFAASAASIALYAWALPPQVADQDYYDYASLLVQQPSAWFAAAILIGGIRTLHAHKELRAKNQLAEAEQRVLTMSGGFNRAMTEIERLERRIATDAATVNRLLNDIAGVDTSQAELPGGLRALIENAMGVSAFKFYLSTSHGLDCILVVSEDGSADADAAPIAGATFESLAASPETITRADVRAPLLPAGALMLAPVTGPNGALHGALVIDRFRTPPHSLSTLAVRARNLGRVIGLLLDVNRRERGEHGEVNHALSAQTEA